MIKKIDKRVLFIVFVLVVLLGKYVRYTVMKDTLVDWGTGYSYVDTITNKSAKFSLTFDSNGNNDQNAGDNAIFLFTIINIFDIDSYGGFEIYITVIWNILLLIILYKLKDYLSITEMIFMFFSIAIINIWDFCLAKEPVQMLFFLVMYKVLIRKKTNKEKNRTFILCTLIYLISALLFRTYYFAMVFFMLFFYFLYRIYISKIEKLKAKDIIIITVFSYLSLLILIVFMKNFANHFYKDLLWIRLKNYSARTAIDPILTSTDIFSFSLNIFIVMARLLFPVEILRFGPKYYLFVLFQLMLSFIVIKNIFNINKISKTKRIALCIYVAFLFGSSLFEPDFGSWIRHEAVTFPIYILLTNTIKEKE